MQSHIYAKYLRICANFGLMNAKQEKNGTYFMYMTQFDNFFLSFICFLKSILTHVSAQTNFIMAF